jgi:thermitase
MSFSVSEDSPAIRDAINFASQEGVILVAAAGNSGVATSVWPAAYANVIGVAATDNFYVRAPWSNYGTPLVSLAAPGDGVLTMYPNNHYAKVSGTSFSSPLVAGGAALLVDLNRRTNEAAADAAFSHARPLGQELGAGELDLYQACLSLSRR